MKMVNNGYVSKIPQDLEGAIEELQQGGSGGGVNAFPMTYDESFEKLLDASGTEVTYAALLAAAQAGKLCYIYGTGDAGFFIQYLANIRTEPDPTLENYLVLFSELGTAVSAVRFKSATTSDVLEWYEV